jgi:hypothetical protein
VLHNPRLLAGEQFVPHRLEPFQRLANFVLGQVRRLGPHRLPATDDDLRLPDLHPHFRQHHRLDLVGNGGDPMPTSAYTLRVPNFHHVRERYPRQTCSTPSQAVFIS